MRHFSFCDFNLEKNNTAPGVKYIRVLRQYTFLYFVHILSKISPMIYIYS